MATKESRAIYRLNNLSLGESNLVLQQIGDRLDSIEGLRGSTDTPQTNDVAATSQTSDVASASEGYYKNLVIANGANPDEQVDVDADVLVVTSSAGESVRLTSVNLTIDNTASEVNGLDTGVVGNGTWYYLYVIYNGTTTAGLISESPTAPTLPSGYTYFLKVGAIITDGTADFLLMSQRDNRVGITDQEVITAGNDTGLTSVDLSSAVPLGVKSVRGHLAITTPGDSVSTSVASNANGIDENSMVIAPATTIYDGNYGRVTFNVLIETAQTMFYKMNSGARALDGYITGWEF